MTIHRRAIQAAFLCAIWLFAAFPAAAASAAQESLGAGQILALPGFNEMAESLVGSLHKLIAHVEAFARFEAFATSRAGIITLALGIATLVVAWFATRRLRGTGQLTLKLRFPNEVDGDFEVCLRRRSRHKVRTPSVRAAPPHTRASVHRETQFDRVHPGAWFLSIEGTIRASKSHTILLRVDEEIEVQIDAGSCTPIEHDFAPPEAPIETPVEFRVQWDRQRARDVGLCLAGQPETLRYAGHGVIKMSLPVGAHEFLIGAGDRVIEHLVDITNYEPRRVQIDLGAPERIVFKGCPPAVSSFLQGDLREAARALERDAQADVAALMLARLHQEQGQIESAAEQLENAGCRREAAELRKSISDFERAAALYEASGSLREAAEMYDAAGIWPEAARAFGALEDWREAARCYEAAGDVDGVIGALEGQGEIFRAAAIATDHDDRARAIRLLQKISPQDPDFGRAGEWLALAYEQEGHLDLAAAQLERCLSALPPGQFAPELEIHLSELLEDSGEVARALDVLSTLRDRDPTYPQIAARIEGVRKKLSAIGRDNRPGALARAPDTTAFVAQERYQIIEEIGRGGMGHVYKARDRRLGRVVALKRMPENLRDHPAAVQLFLGEAQAAARMNHPNIVTLYDADQENDDFFITMELLDGLPLNQILEERGCFSPQDTARLGIQVCAGLQFAHDQGIVHRDIKTSNLFITRDRVLKIMDFGLAKILEAVRNGSSSIIAGTPSYMAPEQAAGRVADGRTDLYALGVTLFELSTGKLPFSEGDLAEQHRNRQAPDPAQAITDYPKELADLIRRLMSKSPEDRPSRADEVAQELSAIVESA
jgi:tRNA A-37 threonylcarbamoyl transferase component Bud32/predicted negative regulator of RcsB-dependent stress response